MLYKMTIWLLLLVLIAACSSPHTAASPTRSPSPEPTVLPSTTSVPPERIWFTAVKNISSEYEASTVISFVNSDGTGFDSPSLFEPFYDTYQSTGKYLAWSPDGRYLAFDGADTVTPCEPPASEYCFTTNYGTFVADYPGNAIVQHVEGTLTNASWSPDSRYLVVSVQEEPGSQIGDLMILDMESGETTPLTRDPASDLYPSWSPDGEWIAFIRFAPDPDSGCGPFPHSYGGDRCFQGSLYLIRPDGSDLQLFHKSVFIHDSAAPAWSPDGQWLAFSKVIEREYGQSTYYDVPNLFIRNVITGQDILVSTELRVHPHPAWSPEGQILAYDAIELHFWGNTDTAPINGDSPAWSSSGAFIAYVWKNKLWVMNADGTNSIMIDEDYYWVRGIPAWQPNPQP